MSSANSGQSIGAGVITIGFDDSQVVAGLAKDKQLLTQFVATPANVKLGLDPASQAKFATDLNKFTAQNTTPLGLKAVFSPQLIQQDFRKLLADLQVTANANPIRLTVQGGTPGVGGGGGGGGGSGGGGARGGIGPNYFSNRGIGRLIGNATAGFAIVEAARLAGDFGEAAQIASHPERIQRGFQELGGAHDVMRDQYVGQQSQAIASSKAGEKVLESIESVPLLGSLVKLSDSALGLSGTFKDEQEAATKAIQAHLKAVDGLDQLNINTRKESGDVAGADQAARQITVDKAFALANAAPNDPVAQKFAAETRDYEQQQLVNDDQKNQARLLNRNDTLASLDDRRKAEEAQTGKNDRLAMRYRQEAERRELLDKYRTQYAAISPENQKERSAVETEYKGAAAELGAKQKGDLARQEEATQQRITAAVASGQAAQFKATHDGFAAQMVEFEAASKARLAAIHDGGGQETQATKFEIDEKRKEMVAANAQEISDTQDSYQDRIQAAKLREGRNDFQAGLLTSVNAEERGIAHLKPELQQDATLALKAETEEKIREHNRQINIQKNVLEAHTESSKLRAQDQFMHADVEDLRTDIYQQIENAPIELKQSVMKNAKARLDEERHRLFDLHGGAQAIAIGQHEIAGDPLDLTGQAKDRKAAQADLDQARKKLGDAISKGEDPNNPNSYGADIKKQTDLQTQMLEKLQKLIDAYSAVGLAGSP